MKENPEINNKLLKRCILVFLLIDVQAESINPKPELAALLVFDVKIVDAVHFQVLRNLQVLHHSIIPVNTAHEHIMQLSLQEHDYA